MLPTEIYKTINGLAAVIKNRIFEIKVLNMGKCWKIIFWSLRKKMLEKSLTKVWEKSKKW